MERSILSWADRHGNDLWVVVKQRNYKSYKVLIFTYNILYYLLCSFFIMENLTINPSYEEARENFKNRIDNIPNEEDITPNFINTHMSDFIMTWKPNQESEISQREKDKRCASVLLWKAITNIQLTNWNQKKDYTEDTDHKLLLNFKEKKIILPDNIKSQRDSDIKILELFSHNYESKKEALIRFENIIKKYIPDWIEILNNYRNNNTKRLSLQKISSALQLWNKESSLLKIKVINKIQ